MAFTFETSGNNTFLVYAIQEEDVLDTMTLGMITNNRIPGMASVLYTQMNRDCFLKYNVTAKVTVKQFFSGVVNKRRLLGVFSSVAEALAAAEEYMIDSGSLLLDTDYIYVDVRSCRAEVVCLPVIREAGAVDSGMFFKNIMFSTQFDQTENCDYVAGIINYLNSTPTFVAEDFLRLLKELQGAEGTSSSYGGQGFWPQSATTPQAGAQMQFRQSAPDMAQSRQSAPASHVSMAQPQQSAPAFQANMAQSQQDFQAGPMAQSQQPAPASQVNMAQPQQPAPASQANMAQPQQPAPATHVNMAQPQQSAPASRANMAQPQQSAPVSQAKAPVQPQSAATPGKQGNPAATGAGFAVPGQGGVGGFAVPGQGNVGGADPKAAAGKKQKKAQQKDAMGQSVPQDPAPEKGMSMFYLLQHYNKENAAAYKAQKEAKKKGGNAAPAASPAPASGFAVPGQQTQPPMQQPGAQWSCGQAPIQQPLTRPQSFSSSDNFGDTVVMGADGFGGDTVVIGEAMAASAIKPYLLRSSNNERILLDKPIFHIGKERSYVDYCISGNPTISRSHADIIGRNGQFFIVDNNSTNHTYINGEMIPSNTEIPLSHGTKIRLSNEEFEFLTF